MQPLYHVLIAEDDPFIRKVLRQTLKDEFTVITKENGIEAVSWLEEGNPVDIILSDIQMPHMDGKDLLRTLRASPTFQNLPIIILSTFADSATRISCLKLGADDYIVKPFNPIEVKTKISTVLRRLEATNPRLPLSHS
ncbi:response regulator [Spirosoma utsteinense]|uniref:DNA-binding response OmpR family regulator n=1 Tax=Spirosoma utsteinense TaxID=2585773 RepID=A0ABR6WDD3_9BACT|nr:response regulator [Spirosoma utsteinense]MBC3788212.1 DNA-binding response OmpR family regulator [Spirosoma utsteinense]MBC3794173.1 DNA-binding response OmpR family regulator [Spirosoma utsteinense]